jgi:hypothetical protein
MPPPIDGPEWVTTMTPGASSGSNSNAGNASLHGLP